MRRPVPPRCRRGPIARALGTLLLVVGCAGRLPHAELVLDAPRADYDAEVYVDGHYVGQVGALVGQGRRLRLAPGDHRVEVRKPGRFPLQRTVRVPRRPPPRVRVAVDLPPDPET